MWIQTSGIILEDTCEAREILKLSTEAQCMLGRLLLARVNGKSRNIFQTSMLDTLIAQAQDPSFDGQS